MRLQCRRVCGCTQGCQLPPHTCPCPLPEQQDELSPELCPFLPISHAWRLSLVPIPAVLWLQASPVQGVEHRPCSVLPLSPALARTCPSSQHPVLWGFPFLSLSCCSCLPLCSSPPWMGLLQLWPVSLNPPSPVLSQLEGDLALGAPLTRATSSSGGQK